VLTSAVGDAATAFGTKLVVPAQRPVLAGHPVPALTAIGMAMLAARLFR
jgi:hypothetical protein